MAQQFKDPVLSLLCLRSFLGMGLIHGLGVAKIKYFSNINFTGFFFPAICVLPAERWRILVSRSTIQQRQSRQKSNGKPHRIGTMNLFTVGSKEILKVLRGR